MKLHRAWVNFWVGLVSFLIGITLALPVLGQGSFPIPGWESPAISLPALPAGVSLQGPYPEEYLRQGDELERAGRWADAVVFYEEALRRFPQDPALLQRYHHSRLRVDIVRRLKDSSYLAVLDSFSLRQAVDALNEALLKVQVHFVDPISWDRLTANTLRGMEVILTEPGIWSRFGRPPDPAGLESLKNQWKQLLAAQAPSDRNQTVKVLLESARLAEVRCGIPASAVLMEMLCTVASLLDIYSCYLTPQQLQEILSQIEGNFVGLGVELKGEEGSLLILRVIPGSPAETAGLRPGDRIIAVGDQPTASLPPEEAANLLQGPEGSLVRLKVQSEGQEARELWIRRTHVEVPSIDGARIIDPTSGVAYLRIAAFQKNTARELDAALWSLYYQGMRSLVVDLRGNPGGLLGSAVESADRFLDRGVIVYTRGRNLMEDCTYVAHEPGTWRVPLVVLIDGQSASAAEIFAAAIRDHRRGKLVGTATYGKGSVQGIFPLQSHRAGLRLTTSRFYSPSGRPFTLEGVAPDVLLRQAARPVSAGNSTPIQQEDHALTVAVQVARELIAQRP
jgi:carboxyl-terminal processing protease